MHQTVTIQLPATLRQYNILVGEGLIKEAGKHIATAAGKRNCLIITDDTVAPLYLSRLESALTNCDHKVLPSITLPAGEPSKSFATLADLLEQIFTRPVDRDTLIVALGGGVMGDLVGFTASIALRGLDFIQVPTTLLSQVDSSVGGKTGINSSYGKNTVGTFYQPLLVLADTATLNTLDPRHVLAGYAEVVKYGLIYDTNFFDWCENNASKLLNGDTEARSHAIQTSCQIKASIVAEDEREAGKRALLNLGHTFGHALESAIGYNDKLLHGEAVAIGTIMAFDLSVSLGLCSESDYTRVLKHFETTSLPTKPPEIVTPIDQLMTYMAQDKKAKDGKLTFIIPQKIGHAIVQRDVDHQAVRSIWAKHLKASKRDT